jgi:hypothetical protein
MVANPAHICLLLAVTVDLACMVREPFIVAIRYHLIQTNYYATCRKNILVAT